jgi:predicted DNA repair protein MutK
MPSGFFALFDDIATLMDDVGAMTKIATKKTAGILGDDLAVNSEKATGFLSSRELPVIWAITKGSFLNKLIILPLIFLLSAYAPQAVIPILMIGGLYLSFEGAEKIYEWIFPHAHKKDKQIEIKKFSEEEILILEKKKIKSAILTDFILSLEIIIIALSTVSDKALSVQIPVLIVVAIVTTLGVYGIVAMIVRMDDFGYKLLNKKNGFFKKIGGFLVSALPWVIKTLGIVGTLAMLLVAGGIFLHNFQKIPKIFHSIPSLIAELLVGIVIGSAVLLFVKLFLFLKSKIVNSSK